MSKIAFITDTTCNMPPQLLEKHQIGVVPVYVIFGGESYKDYVEMPPKEFYRRLMEQRAAGKGMPTTSQPTPEDFREAYQQLADEGYTDVISIHVTAKSSGTCSSAELAKSMVDDINIHVVDSATTSMQMGFMLLDAIEAVDNGAEVEDALRVIETVKENSCLCFTVVDVEHLAASGRTKGHEQATEAALSVKPIVQVLEGVPKAIGKERTQRVALQKVLEQVKAQKGENNIAKLAVVNGNVQEKAESWAHEAKSFLNFDGEPYIVDFGPALAVHFGPGLLGLAAQWE